LPFLFCAGLASNIIFAKSGAANHAELLPQLNHITLLQNI
jgi:hypothetical protein